MPRAERRAALDGLPAELRTALEHAADRIRAYHLKQKPADSDSIDAAGVRLGARWRGVDAAGVYVPGGRAAYPSSVLMNAIPARVAGVDRLTMVTPTPRGETNPLVLAAAGLPSAVLNATPPMTAQPDDLLDAAACAAIASGRRHNGRSRRALAVCRSRPGVGMPAACTP